MKWLGSLLLISMTTWIGFDIGKKYSNRPKQIRQFILSLQMLEAEMGYSQLTLQQTFQNISKKTMHPINLFYERLANELSGVVTDFVSIWDDELSIMTRTSALKKNEQEIMRQFGQSLGSHTFMEQQKHIQLTIHHLQRELDEAIDQQKKYGKMMKSLGLLIGFFIVILLF